MLPEASLGFRVYEGSPEAFPVVEPLFILPADLLSIVKANIAVELARQTGKHPEAEHTG